MKLIIESKIEAERKVVADMKIIATEKREQILKLRSFQRSYSRQLGFLNLRTDNRVPFPLVDARILLRIHSRPGCTAVSLSEYLQLDRAAVSRSVKKYINSGYVIRMPSEADGRSYNLYITEKGRAQMDLTTQLSCDIFQTRLIDKLSPEDAERLAELLSEADKIIRSIQDSPT